MTTTTRHPAEATASVRVLLLAGGIVCATCIVSLASFARIWGRQPFEDLPRQPGTFLGAVVVFLAGAALHEFLHAVTWKILASLSWTEIGLRRHRRKLGIIAQPKAAVRASAYRAGVAVPPLLMGALPMAAGLARDNGLILLWGCVFLFESFSDIAILLALRGVPSVTEQPVKLGVTVSGITM